MRIAFIVSYRDRDDHLKVFVPHYKTLFPDCDIFAVEQCDQLPFRRGTLLNIGFEMACQIECNSPSPYEAFDLCDIDMISWIGHVNWSYPEKPAHLATQASQFNYTMPYPDYFSGHILLTKEQMESVNGYSNKFFGWGGEDNSFFNSFTEKAIDIEHRWPGKFHSLQHQKQTINADQYNKNIQIMNEKRDFSEGLSTCLSLTSSVRIDEKATITTVNNEKFEYNHISVIFK